MAAGCYVDDDRFNHIMMAMETVIDKDGVHCKEPQGTPQEQAELEQSYKHLCTLRDEVISLGVLPRQRVARTQPQYQVNRLHGLTYLYAERSRHRAAVSRYIRVSPATCLRVILASTTYLAEQRRARLCSL